MSPGSTTLATVSVEAPASRLVTLPRWSWDPFDREAPRTLGWIAARWVESWLVQPNGPRVGKPFRLTRDQLTFLLWMYALDDEAQWIYDHLVARLAKGTGKSPFAAVLALTEFCAPVRLERFDDRVPGGCRGRPVDMPLVQVYATAESQTANTMRMVRAFAPKGSKVVEAHGIDPGKTIYYRPAVEGTLEVKTSSATAAEGAESSFAIADETEHWVPSNGGPALASTLIDNLVKSGARMLETANAWRLGTDSVAEDTWRAWVTQEEGRDAEDREYVGLGRILYHARLAPPELDLSTVDGWRTGLEHTYADCDWKRRPDGSLDLDSILRRVTSPKASPLDMQQKYLNWPTAIEDAWCTPEAWNRLAKPREVPKGTRIVMFFDGSKSRDATALIGCELDSGYVFTLGVWEPDRSRGETIDAARIDHAVEVAFRDYDVVAFFADVREWESFVLTDWPNRFGDQLKVDSAPNARPSQKIAWDMRGHVYEFCKQCEAVLEEIETEAFEHDGNSALARHVANAIQRPYKDAIGVRKASPDSPLKIDAAVAMIGARMVRRIALSKVTRPGKFRGARR